MSNYRPSPTLKKSNDISDSYIVKYMRTILEIILLYTGNGYFNVIRYLFNFSFNEKIIEVLKKIVDT